MSDPEPIELPAEPAKPQPPAAASRAKSGPRPKAAKNRASTGAHEGLWNLLTALLLAAAFFVASVYVLVYTRPELVAQIAPLGTFIPIPPTAEQPQPTQQQPSPTATLEPTQAAAPTSETALPTPTATARAVEATPVDPNATPQGTPDAISFYAFNVQGEINAIDGTIIDQNHGCEWMGVAGRILDADGSPIAGLQVHLVGYIDGRTRDLLTLSGTGLAFGPGGYEFTLASRPIRTVDSVWVQLVEQNGLPLSPRIRFNTYAECEKNLIVINFIKVK